MSLKLIETKQTKETISDGARITANNSGYELGRSLGLQYGQPLLLDLLKKEPFGTPEQIAEKAVDILYEQHLVSIHDIEETELVRQMDQIKQDLADKGYWSNDSAAEMNTGTKILVPDLAGDVEASPDSLEHAFRAGFEDGLLEQLKTTAESLKSSKVVLFGRRASAIKLLTKVAAEFDLLGRSEEADVLDQAAVAAVEGQPAGDQIVSNLKQILRDSEHILSKVDKDSVLMGWIEDNLSSAKTLLSQVRNTIETDGVVSGQNSGTVGG